MRKLLHLFVTILALAVLTAGTVIALAPSMRQLASSTSSEPEEIDLAALDEVAARSYVYASDGSLLGTLHGPENRQPVSLATVPREVIDSILAVEDSDFYNHRGVNFRALGRALVQNVSVGSIEQGGSTITQQLLKNTLLSSERDLDRKSKEAIYAIRIEQQLSKDEILEKYLNTVYFGAGAYGVQAAAEVYWGKDVGELGWAEGALLAALISNPGGYDPTLYPDTAYKRRQIALERIAELGYITREEADRYSSEPLPVRRCGKDEPNRPVSCGDAVVPPAEDYFVEAVKQQLLADTRLGATPEERFSAVFGGGLRIYTTLDPAAQQAAQDAHDNVTPKNDLGVTSAIVSVDSHTGAVRALVGGPGFDKYKFDVATHQPGRQTGSSFKVFVLLTALQQDNYPFDTIAGGGSFKNDGGYPNPYKIQGQGGTLTSVTLASSNGAYVRLGQVVGLESVIQMARNLGVTSEMDSGILSLPLGVALTTPLEMASAYTAIPNGGVYNSAYMVERIEDRSGHTLVTHKGEPTQVFSPQVACYATDILRQNVQYGTGTRARLSKQDAAGKTGTTEDNYDAWFVGFTPYLTTAVWMGNPDQNVSMRNLGGVENFGGTYPAMIFKAFNDKVHQDLDVVRFDKCPPIKRYARAVKGWGDPKANTGYVAPQSTTTTAHGSTTTKGESGSTTTAAPAPSTTAAPPPDDDKPPDPPPGG